MEKSPLKRLPVELRLYIYELTFTPAPCVDFTFDLAGFPKLDKTLRTIVDEGSFSNFAITQACKEIEAESLPIFYTCYELVVDAKYRPWLGDTSSYSDKVLVLQRALDNIPEVSRSKLYVTADLGSFDLRNMVSFQATLIELLKKYSKHMKLRLSGPCSIKFSVWHYRRPLHDPIAIGVWKRIDLRVDCRDLVKSRHLITETLQMEAHAYSDNQTVLNEARRRFESL